MFSVKTISRLLTHLVEQGLAERGGVKSFLLPPLRQRPSSGSTSLTGPLPCIRSSPFAGWSCLPVWARPPRAWTLLAEKTGIPSDTLYGYLKGFLRLGVIKRTKEGRAYCYSPDGASGPQGGAAHQGLWRPVLFKSIRTQALLQENQYGQDR